MNAGELIILGRQLTRIGTAALRDAQLPGGAMPTGISLVGADVLAHPATSVSEIARRTGLRQSYVSESVMELRDRGVVETDHDPADEGRTRVRLAADARPERATTAALADVAPAVRGALGPGAGPGTVTTVLASFDELARQLGSRTAGPGAAEPGLPQAAPGDGLSEVAPGPPAGDAGDEEEETEETLPTRAVPTRAAGTDADPRESGEPDAHGGEDGPGAGGMGAGGTDAGGMDAGGMDATRADGTRVDGTRVDRTRVDLSRTRVDATRADRTRVDLPVGNTANARRAVRAKTEPAAGARSGRKRQGRLSRIARYLTGD